MLKVKEQKLAQSLKQRLSQLEKLTKRLKLTLIRHMNKTYQDEFDKIQSEYKKVKKSKKKSSSSSKKTSHPLSYYIRK